MADWNVTSQKLNQVAILMLSARGKMPTEIRHILGMSHETVYRTVARGTAEAPKKVYATPARDPETVEAISNTIKEKDIKKMVKALAWEFEKPRTTMRRLVNDNLGLKSFKRTPRQALKPVECKKRVAAAKKCLNLLKKNPCGVVLLDLNETPFSLGEMVTPGLGYYLAMACSNAPDSTVHFGKEHHFANLQVIAMVGADSKKCPLVFLEASEQLNAWISCKYIKYLQEIVFPRATSMYGKGWWLQHDGATAHTANATQQFLNGHAPGFIPRTPQMPPPWTTLSLGIWSQCSVASNSRAKTSWRPPWWMPDPTWTWPSSKTAARSSGASWNRLWPTMEAGLSKNCPSGSCLMALEIWSQVSALYPSYWSLWSPGLSVSPFSAIPVFFTTKRLIKLTVLPWLALHADAPYKLIWNGFPVLLGQQLVGTHFTLLALWTNEDEDSFAFLLRTLHTLANEINGAPMHSSPLLYDAAAAICNGFNTAKHDVDPEETSPTLCPLCWFHMAFNNKKLHLIKSDHKQERVHSYLHLIQLSPNTEFSHSAKAASKKKSITSSFCGSCSWHCKEMVWRLPGEIFPYRPSNHSERLH